MVEEKQMLIRWKYTVYSNYGGRRKANAHLTERYSVQKLWWKKKSKYSFGGIIQSTETMVEEEQNAHLTEKYSLQKLW